MLRHRIVLVGEWVLVDVFYALVELETVWSLQYFLAVSTTLEIMAIPVPVSQARPFTEEICDLIRQFNDADFVQSFF